MGEAFSGDAAQGEEENVKAELQMLMSMARKQEKLYQQQVIAYYQNPDEFKEYEVVGGRMVSDASFISVKTKSSVDDLLMEGVSNIVGGLFGLASDDEKDDTKSKFESGTKSLISGAFKAMFGSSSGSEMTQQEFFILPFGYTFYRVDVFMWRFNVDASAGVYDKAESVYVSVASCGVLDTADLKPDELIAFVQQIEGRNKDNILAWFKDYLEIRKGADELVREVQELDKK
eukprot:CAMPEP_0201564610 /NCGR_PEP_ID=MMETSP0190_2-20130828/3059_1 /ASSEMBLY_ACC=CAM_ASM_000263 /TAXON_ID=37353 /ORGANISM="Rosalina sp." /LENGTH=230 /DNA_ID=CAMNT_0047981019 /DNA_START=85 /DNA_END=777 /DNA_ORIENTATION=+